ncbi:MAG TPA: NAD-dependent malic enzyme [Oligoflexia bacterium]|nr:NAD-dependent malic enzyme [Oligoflexia bacterium]
MEHASAGYSVTIRVRIKNIPGKLSRLLRRVGALGGSIAEVVLLHSEFHFNIREITINCSSVEHAEQIIRHAPTVEGIELISWRDDTFELHRGGKLEIASRTVLRTHDQLSRAYTPGVARVCAAIASAADKAHEYTIKGNFIAIVTDGSAVLGMGNIGPAAALPVMEGKAILFKQFGGVDAFPVCLATQQTEEIIQTVQRISPVFGGINLEDVAAPRCFEIEERLQDALDVPVFHDDQHGTAVVVLAGLLNAVKLVGKELPQLKVVINGFGAAGVACARILLSSGVGNIVPCDSHGIIHRGRKEGMNLIKQNMAEKVNPNNEQGSLTQALRQADVFIGVSAPGVLTPDMVREMSEDPIVFALANPVPEIDPEELQGIARVIATGRSDYENQINNVLCFPGLFRGALDCRARKITEGMKLAAARAIAQAVSVEDLGQGRIVPDIYKEGLGALVARSVSAAAAADGVARVSPSLD